MTIYLDCIIILVILWLLGFFGRNVSSSFRDNRHWIHLLIVIALILQFELNRVI